MTSLYCSLFTVYCNDMTPIYTRKGDSGETGLGDGRRVAKTDPRIEAVGTIDELNSAVGLAISLLPHGSQLRGPLLATQNQLLDLGAHMALPQDAATQFHERLPPLSPAAITTMETLIDGWWAACPPLAQFILPGGAPSAAALHLARSISRRAERAVLRLEHEETAIEPVIIQWLNRSSDYFFAAARFANLENGRTDIHWQKQK